MLRSQRITMRLAFYFLKAVGLKAVECRTLAALPVNIGGQSIPGGGPLGDVSARLRKPPWAKTKLRALNSYSCMTYHIFAGKA